MSYGYGEGRIEQALVIAEGFDCDVMQRRPNELQLDLDSSGAEETMKAVIVILKDRLPELLESGSSRFGVDADEWASKSGNLHVVIRLSKVVSDLEAVALQCMLGSDPLREALNYSRIVSGIPSPILLFKPRPKKLMANRNWTDKVGR